jgi:CBS domain-containing protein
MIHAARDASIRDAARLMKKHRVSSLLIIDHGRLAGILTDRDLRERVLAEGISDTTAIEQVMTHDPLCIDAGGRLHDAQIKMMSEGIHHLPVTKADQPVGIITLSDILRANNTEPLSLIQSINRSDNVDALKEAAKGLPALIVELVERDTRAMEVGRIVTAVSDSITKRLLLLAQSRYGEPPCDYAWLGFGSQARQEQVIGSDQDNGLLLPDGTTDEDKAYFRDFTDFVNTGLDQCGMPCCPGDIMARNDKWRLTLQGWKDCFARWIQQPSPKAIMHASIFFDMRHIAGRAELTGSLHRYVLDRAKNNTIFQAYMCDNALFHSPPLGFFKTFVLESDGDHNRMLDLKKRGTIPVVDIARNFALSVGLPAMNTIERLEGIVDSGTMSAEMSSSLIDAHEFIAGLRLEDQGRKYMAGQAVDNYLDPSRLSPLLRHQLKDAFAVVREAQAAMKARFGGGVLL